MIDTQSSIKGAAPAVKLVLSTVLLAVAAFVGIPRLVDLIVYAGRNIPYTNILEDYCTGLIWAIGIAISIRWWPVPREHKLPLLKLWTCKVLVMLGFMLWYESHYDILDAYGYFMDARTPRWELTGLGEGTFNVYWFSAILCKIIPYSYHTLKVTFGLIGLVGHYFFARAAAQFLGDHYFRPALFLALVPSCLFWSSIIGKDPIVFAGTGIYAYGVVRWLRTRDSLSLLVIVIGVLISFLIRMWMAVIYLLPFVVLVAIRTRSLIARLVLMTVFGATLMYAAQEVAGYFAIESQEELFEFANEASRAWAIGGSGQQLTTEFTGYASMLAFLPLGVFTALLRPLPGDVMNPFGLLAGLENVVLLAITLLAIKRSSWRDFTNVVLLWSVLFVLVWSVLYAFISYQNLGAAVRFRLPVLPVFCGLIVYQARRREVRSVQQARVINAAISA